MRPCKEYINIIMFTRWNKFHIIIFWFLFAVHSGIWCIFITLRIIFILLCQLETFIIYMVLLVTNNLSLARVNSGMELTPWNNNKLFHGQSYISTRRCHGELVNFMLELFTMSWGAKLLIVMWKVHHVFWNEHKRNMTLMTSSTCFAFEQVSCVNMGLKSLMCAIIYVLNWYFKSSCIALLVPLSISPSECHTEACRIQ